MITAAPRNSRILVFLIALGIFLEWKLFEEGLATDNLIGVFYTSIQLFFVGAVSYWGLAKSQAYLESHDETTALPPLGEQK